MSYDPIFVNMLLKEYLELLRIKNLQSGILKVGIMIIKISEIITTL